MVALAVDAKANRAGDSPTYWAIVSCPRCAGAVLIETNSPNESPPKAIASIPEDERVGAQVAHLPADVERLYRDAQRVLDAGVPDAAAVQEHPGPAIHFQAVERGEPFRDSASASLAVSKELAPIAARAVAAGGFPSFWPDLAT